MKPFTYDIEENLKLEDKINAADVVNYAHEFGKDPEKTRMLCLAAVRVFAATASKDPLAALLTTILPRWAPVKTYTLIDAVFALEKILLDIFHNLNVNPGPLLLAAIFKTIDSSFMENINLDTLSKQEILH